MKLSLKTFLLTTAILLALILTQARAEVVWDSFSNEQIVEAIGKAENSVKYPYGIKSIHTKGNKEYARQICLNSVRNGRRRWTEAKKPCDLIEFISRRYCPINAPDDNGTNQYWTKNVKYYLLKYHRLAER